MRLYRLQPSLPPLAVLVAWRASALSKAWTECDEAEDCRVYNLDDPASLFQGEEPPTAHRCSLDDMPGLYATSSQAPDLGFTAGLRTHLCFCEV